MKKSLIAGIVSATLLTTALPVVTSQNQPVLAAKKQKVYNERSFEKALNAGKNMQGKKVKFRVKKIEPQSAFGFNLEAGKHLNFVSSTNPGVKKGRYLTVKVKKVTYVLGSYVITYTIK